ncbi:MAG: hypothetical protein M1828_006698 [Chrysothrix sp. TS-e1954]|nr:MAG: hypothetical protein M1828_006698 [Chrysothrix sp. TS-e1954]
MNADALLKDQGWRGKGYSLDQSDRGLSKPLLVRHKRDSAGLGSKKEDFGNQWWLKAWDKSLQQSTSTEVLNSHLEYQIVAHTLQTESVVPKPHEINPRLYSSFVKADSLVGTLTDIPEMASDPAGARSTQHKDKTSKKRKHVEEAEDAVLPNRDKKRSKSTSSKTDGSAKDVATVPQHDVEPAKTNGLGNGAAAASEAPQTGAQAYQRRQGMGKEKKTKLRPKDVRAERKKARQDKSRNNALKNRQEKKKAATGANDVVVAEQRPPKEKLPLHPESITALRQKGEKVILPDPPLPPRDTRVWFTKDNEPAPNMPAYVHERILAGAENYQQKGGINPLTDGDQPKKKKSYKADKYERERLKRQMKREWRFWQEIRQNPDDYRPDGTRITLRDRGIERPKKIKPPKEPGENGQDGDATGAGGDNQPKKKTKKEVRKETALEKAARRELKEKMKVERRVARKMIRAEKKQKNHIAMQAHISAKLKLKKRENEEKLAAEKGMTWAEWNKQNIDRRNAERLERQTKAAEEAGISLEEYRQGLRVETSSKSLEKEARKLGLSVEDYANQAADPDDSELGSDDEKEGGLKDGTFQHFGRSPIDKLWAKHKAEAAAKAKEEEVQHKANGEGSRAPQDDDSDSSSDANSSDSDSDTDGSSSPESSDSGEEVKDAKTSPARSNGVSKPAVTTKAPAPNAAAANEDFIPLTISDDESGGAPLIFVVDDKGDSQRSLANQKKRVKDMTKEERKARLEAMRARRAARAEASGVTKLSKKARRAARSQRKDALLLKMTQDIVHRRKSGTMKRYNGDAGPMPGVPEPAYEPVAPPKQREDGKKVKDKRSAESKSQFKQARREARRIMRNMKKGKLADHEIPEGWEHLPRRKTPKLKGNGGRIPKKVNR